MSSSDRSREHLAKELKEIKVQLAELLERVGDLEASIWSPSEVWEGSWEVIEAEAEVGSKLSLPLRHHCAEDGPPRPTKAILAFARSRLSSSAVSIDHRVHRSLSAGHWAWAAVETVTVYCPEGPIKGIQSQHWIVLRGAGLSSPFRTTSKRDLLRLVDLHHPETIVKEFPSLTELEIFCSSARIRIPPLKQWRKTSSDLQQRGSQGYC